MSNAAGLRPGPGPMSGPTGERVRARRQALIEVLDNHGVLNARVFGSVARGDERPGSDLDLLVDLPAGTSLVDILDLGDELSSIVGTSVDLVPASGLRDRVLANAEREAIPL